MSARKSRKGRLDRLLVERGLAPDERTASAWVMARKVRVGSDYVTKPGTAVREDAPIEVVGIDRRYVSRGGEKLEAALRRFGVSASGAVVLDAGASTGGFTDCLLAHGAARVYSVDVGFGQLRGSIAADPRVVPLERTNIADLRREQLDPPIDLCVADLSYLSVRQSFPILAPLFESQPVIIHLIKPLFEGVPQDRATDRVALASVMPRVVEAAEARGLVVRGWMASPILGSNGTVEFFALLGAGAGSPSVDEDASERALDEALRVPAEEDAPW